MYLNNVFSLLTTPVDLTLSKGGMKAQGQFARCTGCLALGSLEALTLLLLLRDRECMPAKLLGSSMEGHAEVSPWQ